MCVRAHARAMFLIEAGTHKSTYLIVCHLQAVSKIGRPIFAAKSWAHAHTMHGSQCNFSGWHAHWSVGHTFSVFNDALAIFIFSESLIKTTVNMRDSDPPSLSEHSPALYHTGKRGLPASSG